MRSGWLSSELAAEVYLKLENFQVTGSFKIRGAANKLLLAPPGVIERGVVTASTGNHGLAVAHIAAQLGAPCRVYIPSTARPAKLDLLRSMGTTLLTVGDDAADSEAAARAYADDAGECFVSPYNDFDVISGQGTIGLELTQQIAQLDVLLVAVGGGGMISGVAAVVKEAWPDLRIVGCTPDASPVMARSVAAGRVVDFRVGPTLSDGTAGGLEPGTITLPFCTQLVDEWWSVSEEQIARALLTYVDQERQLIEGAAAVPIAAARANAARLSGLRVGIVVCGANISLSELLGLQDSAW